MMRGHTAAKLGRPTKLAISLCGATHIIRNIVGNVGNTTMLCHTVTFVLTGNPAFGEPYKRWKKRLQLGIWPN